MQLKITRSQKQGGIVSKNAIFCLNARVEFTPHERADIIRYKLGKQVIYNSEASTRHLDQAAAHQDGSMAGGLKALASLALAAMKLNITIDGLERGQYIECKSLDELLGAENAIMTACHNLKGYLETAATFDGREVLIEFSSDQPQVIAYTAPADRLAAPEALSAPYAMADAPAQPARVSETPPALTYAHADNADTPATALNWDMEDLGRFVAQHNLLPKIAVGAILVVVFWGVVGAYL